MARRERVLSRVYERKGGRGEGVKPGYSIDSKLFEPEVLVAKPAS